MNPMPGVKTTDLRETAAASKKRLASWTSVPVGSKVSVLRDDGRLEEHSTRSAPWMLCGTPVIMLTGITGGFALARCTFVAPPVQP